MKQKSKTMVAEEQERLHKGFLNQSCAVCNVNHDYEFHGRTIACICGAWLRESGDKKHKLIRVG